MLGLDASSRTTENLLRTGECVLNLASDENVDAVNRLALTTGSVGVPLHKRLLGYRYEPEKLGCASLTALPSTKVRPPRLAECKVHLESVLQEARPVARNDRRWLFRRLPSRSEWFRCMQTRES
jgi:flavin reductase (DIM6/NTAB) family NADH-FMN oxidoreductase RutF